jgi:hypothetical protein
MDGSNMDGSNMDGLEILGGFGGSDEGNELHHFIVVTFYFLLNGCHVFHVVQVVEIGELTGNGIN